jgi:carbamoyltransferase
MTLSFNSTKIAQKDLVAAIHPKDKTIRPQMVKFKDSKKYYNLIKEFKKISGIGGLLNTSLNIHEKPVILQPTDIINDFIKTKKILIDNIYVYNTIFSIKKNH